MFNIRIFNYINSNTLEIKAMKHYQSTLTQISEQVYSAKSADETKQIIVDYLSTTRVKDRDTMIKQVQTKRTLNEVWFYFSNSLLKFEQLGTSQF